MEPLSKIKSCSSSTFPTPPRTEPPLYPPRPHSPPLPQASPPPALGRREIGYIFYNLWRLIYVVVIAAAVVGSSRGMMTTPSNLVVVVIAVIVVLVVVIVGICANWGVLTAAVTDYYKSFVPSHYCGFSFLLVVEVMLQQLVCTLSLLLILYC